MLNRRSLLLAAGASLLAPPVLAEDRGERRSAPLARLLDDIQAQNLRQSPELATRLGVDTGPLAAARRALDDRSLAGREARKRKTAEQYARLKAFDRASLTGMDVVDYDSVVYPLAVNQEADRRFDFGRASAPSPYVLSHTSLTYQTLSQFLSGQQPMKDAGDADAFLARMEAMAAAIDQDTEAAAQDSAAGVVPPDFILDLALAQMASARAQAADRAPVIAALDAKTRQAGLPERYRAAGRSLLAQKIMPAVARQDALLRRMRAKATPEPGLWKLKDGEAYYAYALKAATTASLTPDEAHRLGEELGAQVSAEMDKALRAQGLTRGTVGERMAALYADPRYPYPNTDAGKRQEIADLQVKLDAMRARLPRWFGHIPTTRLEARREPVETEAVAPPGHFSAGSLDGSRPAVFYLNLRDTREMPMWIALDVALHESVPGHYVQVSLQQEMTDLPAVRRAQLFGGYAEGWAVYAESLADEMGAFDGDPLGRIGYLKSILFRCGRLVVDTGIHTKRWSREQSVAWMVDSGSGIRSMVEGEVNRYCADPGQACAYMVGKLAIDRLRRKAEKALGPRFDIRQFHDAVLLGGAMPLDTLETMVDRYIARETAA